MVNKNLKAFSIIEAIVAMAIAAIIIGITFTIFSIISERLLDYKKQNAKTNDLNRFTYLINKDIFDSENVTTIDNHLLFENYTNEKTEYVLEEDKILRYNKELVDTFQIRHLYFNIDSVKNKSENVIYQKLKMNVMVDSVPMSLAFYKRVYPNQLLEKKFQK